MARLRAGSYRKTGGIRGGSVEGESSKTLKLSGRVRANDRTKHRRPGAWLEKKRARQVQKRWRGDRRRKQRCRPGERRRRFRRCHPWGKWDRRCERRRETRAALRAKAQRRSRHDWQEPG